MKRSLFLVFMVTALLFTAVSHSSDGTQPYGPDTEFVVDSDNGVSDFYTVSTGGSQGFTVTNSVEHVAWLPGSDAILVGANLSFEAEKYFIRSHKLNDLCPAPVFRTNDTHFG